MLACVRFLDWILKKAKRHLHLDPYIHTSQIRGKLLLGLSPLIVALPV